MILGKKRKHIIRIPDRTEIVVGCFVDSPRQ